MSERERKVLGSHQQADTYRRNRDKQDNVSGKHPIESRDIDRARTEGQTDSCSEATFQATRGKKGKKGGKEEKEKEKEKRGQRKGKKREKEKEKPKISEKRQIIRKICRNKEKYIANKGENKEKMHFLKNLRLPSLRFFVYCIDFLCTVNKKIIMFERVSMSFVYPCINLV